MYVNISRETNLKITATGNRTRGLRMGIEDFTTKPSPLLQNLMTCTNIYCHNIESTDIS